MYPIPGVSVSTAYGKRGPYWSCNANSDGGVHTGVDFACSSGTDILAPIDGQIRHRSYGSAFGSHQFAISPDDDQPFGDDEVFFAHTTMRLADGTYVKAGDKIADVGAEGNVSGPHLHMEYHADTKGQWSCSTHDNPQPVLDWEASIDDPTNPNGVKVGDLVTVTAQGSLNGRAAASGDAAVITTKPHGATFVVAAIENGWAQEASS